MSDGSIGNNWIAKYSDDDLLPISALQHWVFCPRQCVLIHVERVWTENRHTAEGRLLHEKAHSDKTERQGDRLIARGLRLASFRLGLTGVSDVVEFFPIEDQRDQGARLPGRRGRWQPFPVEYKRGKPKKHNADKVQLCAQAMCLEEMLATGVPSGALFYGKTRQRVDVVFDSSLRNQVEQLTAQLRDALCASVLPKSQAGPHCKECSLQNTCMPDLPRSATTYIRNMVRFAKYNEEIE